MIGDKIMIYLIPIMELNMDYQIYLVELENQLVEFMMMIKFNKK